MTTAAEAASIIIDDLTGPKGFDALWDELDGEIQQEILEEIVGVIEATIKDRPK